MCVELWDTKGGLSFKILKYSLETKTGSLSYYSYNKALGMLLD